VPLMETFMVDVNVQKLRGVIGGKQREGQTSKLLLHRLVNASRNGNCAKNVKSLMKEKLLIR
jgi:hypothetical protein